MTATKQDLDGWFDEGVRMGATHLIVCVDQFDWDNYPVFVMPGEDVRAKEREYRGKDMQSVDEVYNLKKPKTAQMAEHRSFNY